MKHVLISLLFFFLGISPVMSDAVIRIVGEWKCILVDSHDLYVYYKGPDVAKVEVPDKIMWAESDFREVTHLGKNAFKDLTNLQEVIIPDNLKEICDGAVVNCPNLTKMNLNCRVNVSSNSFVGSPNHSILSRPQYCQPILRYVGPDGKTFDYSYNAPIKREDLPFVKVVCLDPDMTVFRLTISTYDCMDCEIYCDGDTFDERAIRYFAQKQNGRQIYIQVKLKDKKGNLAYPRAIPFTVVADIQ